MADLSNSTPAPCANPVPGDNLFDAAAWLSQFAAAGGWWIVSADDRVHIGWQTKARQPGDIDRAGALWREIEADPAKGREVWDTLLPDGPWRPVPQSAPSIASRSFIAGALGDIDDTQLDANAAGSAKAWHDAFGDFERANAFEEVFRNAVFNPYDAACAAAGGVVDGKVGDEIERLMDMASDATDQARRVALRTPARDASALRWKLDQLLTDNVRPLLPIDEVEQIFADLEQLAGGV